MAERDARPKVPRTTVESTPSGVSAAHAESRGEAGTTVPPSSPHEATAGAAEGEAAREQAGGTAPSAAHARESVRAWVHETFPGHENAVAWGFVGFLVAILFFVIGFWRTLLVVLLVVAGVAFGQVLDGDPKIINTLRGLFSGDNGR